MLFGVGYLYEYKAEKHKYLLVLGLRHLYTGG